MTVTIAGPAGSSYVNTFDETFGRLFDAHFERIFRVLDRLSGDPDLASDIVQEAFVRLYRRGAEPEHPEAWLITVALNLFRNARAKTQRRARLLSVGRGAGAHSDPEPLPGERHEADAARQRARFALDRLDERERRLLLLHAEGYSYRDIASALDLRESSVGTLIARARDAFRAAYQESTHAY